MHVTDYTYTYKDREGDEYFQYEALNSSTNSASFENSRTCADCAITHLIPDCPFNLQGHGVQNQQVEKIPPPSQLQLGQRSPTRKTPGGSPPRSPPQRQVLSQTTKDLLQSQVIKLQADNAKLDLTSGALMQSTVVKEVNTLQSTETTK